MKLLFENSYGEERVIAQPKNEDEAMKAIYSFCEERKFHIYYVRKWKEQDRTKYDVGSWSEFFYLEGEEE